MDASCSRQGASELQAQSALAEKARLLEEACVKLNALQRGASSDSSALATALAEAAALKQTLAQRDAAAAASAAALTTATAAADACRAELSALRAETLAHEREKADLSVAAERAALAHSSSGDKVGLLREQLLQERVQYEAQCAAAKRRVGEVEAASAALKRELAAADDACAARVREAEAARDSADYDRKRAVDKVSTAQC
eukprot:15247-Heterococcus_DN1.PRE.2